MTDEDIKEGAANDCSADAIPEHCIRAVPEWALHLDAWDSGRSYRAECVSVLYTADFPADAGRDDRPCTSKKTAFNLE